MSNSRSFKKFRIFLLLLILLAVSLDSWLSRLRSTDWNDPLWVVVYPVNADASDEAVNYIPQLDTSSYASIENYFVDEARRYGVAVHDPVDVRLGPQINEMPPLPPEQGSIIDIMLWSLKLRYWSVVVDDYAGPRPDIRVFVLYHKLEEGKHLKHSTGLQKGRVCVVNAFADARMTERNNVVIAHEMLHTLGATDKYNLTTGQPIYPLGFAEPNREPLYPQHFAEIMGAYMPVSEKTSVMPESLRMTRVGVATAQEIGWLKE